MELGNLYRALFDGRHRNANRRSRHGSREDVLDDRGSNSNRQSGEYRKRPSQLAVEKSYDESGKYGKMAPSGSQHSLPDIVNDASPRVREDCCGFCVTVASTEYIWNQ